MDAAMSERKLRGAIVGCGYFAGFHLEAWRRMPRVEIVAACDAAPERAAAVAPQSYTDAEAMLRECRPDFVDIVTRPESHLQLVKLAALHGVHAICQKPMAPDWEKSRGMNQAARSAGIRLMIHDNWRWQPWYRQVASAIAAGKIGAPIAYGLRTRQCDGRGPEPYAAQPYFRQMPRFLIDEVLVHHLDVARFLVGDIERIYALARNRNPAVKGEDQGLLALRHRSGVDGWIDGHRFSGTFPAGPVMGEALVDGEEGVLAVTPSGDVLLNGAMEWRNNVTSGYRGDSVYATQWHFVECLQSGAAFETEAGDYLLTVAAVEAAYRSISSGEAVDVPVPD